MYYSIIKQVAHCDRNDGSWQNGIAAHLRRTGGSFGRRLFSCTLDIDGVGYFPDAPTERGVKHLRELAAACGQGYKCLIAFVIQMEEISEVRPNTAIHPEFGIALEEAKDAGVEVLSLKCHVGMDRLEIIGENEP